MKEISNLDIHVEGTEGTAKIGNFEYAVFDKKLNIEVKDAIIYVLKNNGGGCIMSKSFNNDLFDTTEEGIIGPHMLAMSVSSIVNHEDITEAMYLLACEDYGIINDEEEVDKNRKLIAFSLREIADKIERGEACLKRK